MDRGRGLNYYSFHVGDYRRDTTHLTWQEHYIYRTLIDWYFLDETPIPLDNQTITRRLLINSDWIPYLINVLEDYFEKTEKGWVHHRIEWDIKEYKRRCAAHRIAGKLGGRPKKNQLVNSTNQTITKNKLTSNHKPVTNNHIKESTKEKASRLSEDFELPFDWISFYFKEKPDSDTETVNLTFIKFKDYWIAKPGKDGIKLNWFATWRNWIRRERDFKGHYLKKDEKFDPVAYANRNKKKGINERPSEKDITDEVVRTD